MNLIWTRYQTVFAKESGAVAAPTAGLHFDVAMMDKSKPKAHKRLLWRYMLVAEPFSRWEWKIYPNTWCTKNILPYLRQLLMPVRQARERGGRVIAIGTTAVRALESASKKRSAWTRLWWYRLFITPVINLSQSMPCLTNFHLPESTLLMLFLRLLVTILLWTPTVMRLINLTDSLVMAMRCFWVGDFMKMLGFDSLNISFYLVVMSVFRKDSTRLIKLNRDRIESWLTRNTGIFYEMSGMWIPNPFTQWFCYWARIYRYFKFLCLYIHIMVNCSLTIK